MKGDFMSTDDKIVPVILPAEGDSVVTESWYRAQLPTHRPNNLPLILPDGPTDECNITLRMATSIAHFFTSDAYAQHYLLNDYQFELHAHGGFGAFTAVCILNAHPGHIRRVFFIGGAPCNAMTPIAKIFHHYLSRLWYLSHIPFFADDPRHPNPMVDETIHKIRASSTRAMRQNPKYYRNQLVQIGTWTLPPSWKVPESCSAYFIPNGDTIRPSWWDNTYDNDVAAQIWKQHGVTPLPKPGDYFSFYSLMPTRPLFEIMDIARDIEGYSSTSI